MYLKKMFLLSVFTLCQFSFSQKKVAITIDDVPNTFRYEQDGYRSILLNKLDSLKIPIAIFVNEELIYKTDSISKNFELLNNWSRKTYVTLGNHSFGHTRYSITGIKTYKSESLKGESISRELSKKYDKPLHHFRFPYNDLGNDSLQHIKARNFLENLGYQITPFTVESSDWMYNTVYRFYLKNQELKKAKEIGEAYVGQTIKLFNFFETLAKEEYDRGINHIYLCHDNKLNADFLPQLVNELRKRNYEFISLDEALTDRVYGQKNHYFKKWGVSWFYRWKSDQKERIELMKKEPSMENIQSLYESLSEK